MQQYPRMLFKCPGPHITNEPGVTYDFLIVGEAEEAAAVEQGWKFSVDEANAAKKPPAEAKPAAASGSTASEGSPPTRAELEQQATELGIKFDGRTTDKALREKIDAALAA